jgi:hypothetical protein
MPKIETNKINNMQALTIGDNPYGSLICGYFQRQFPHVSKPNKDNLVDILTDIIVGNKDLRLGAFPSPEILVNVRRIIRESIGSSVPVPILIPWGGRKTDPSALIDIAEVSAIHQLVMIDKMIKEFYPFGIQANIGIEDTGAMWLYRDIPNVDDNVEQYSSSLNKLILLLKGTANISPMRESMLMAKDAYFNRSRHYSDLLFKVMMHLAAFPDFNVEKLETYQELVQSGWKGTIPKEQRDYYIGRYKALYGDSDEEATRKLADYFGGAKARYDLHGKAEPISPVKGYIKGTFVSPIPNAPAGLFDTTVYWRTIPTSQARTHIAPWRGKGYLKINKNNVTTKIISWNDEKLSQLESSRTMLSEGSIQVEIQTDYLLEE